MPIDIQAIREQFPILKQELYGKRLVYLDNGATTQKPQSVIDALVTYYATYNSNVHRGVHTLSQRATDAMEASRSKMQHFINAAAEEEIIWTYGTTDSMNIIAHTLGSTLEEGDRVLISEMEHHSNIVPWQMVAESRGARLDYIPIGEEGALDLDALKSQLQGTKILALTWVSNSLGIVNPIEDIIKIAHEHNVIVVLDAAQAIPHTKIDVQALNVDFLVASVHKMYGPTGVGMLYGKKELLEALPPYRGGGAMIKEVTMAQSTYGDLPFRFEAGTPNIAGIIATGTAIDFMESIGVESIEQHEQELLNYTIERLEALPFAHILGAQAKHVKRAGAISLTFGAVHPFDVGELLDKQGIAVRTGHHCCQPTMQHFGIVGTLRPSFAVYNDKDDVDAFINGLERSYRLLQ